MLKTKTFIIKHYQLFANLTTILIISQHYIVKYNNIPSVLEFDFLTKSESYEAVIYVYAWTGILVETHRRQIGENREKVKPIHIYVRKNY